MKSYHFDLGNSNEGPIGMCARVLAKDKTEAVQKLHAALGEYAEISSASGAIEYIHVYFNAEAIDESDIDDWEDEEAGEDA
jgi:hypothetical protein